MADIGRHQPLKRWRAHRYRRRTRPAAEEQMSLIARPARTARTPPVARQQAPAAPTVSRKMAIINMNEIFVFKPPITTNNHKFKSGDLWSCMLLDTELLASCMFYIRVIAFYCPQVSRNIYCLRKMVDYPALHMEHHNSEITQRWPQQGKHIKKWKVGTPQMQNFHMHYLCNRDYLLFPKPMLMSTVEDVKCSRKISGTTSDHIRKARAREARCAPTSNWEL